MSILERKFLKESSFTVSYKVNVKDLSEILRNTIYENQLLGLYNVEENKTEVIQIGNSSKLISDIKELDNQCNKIDIVSGIKNIQLENLLDDERATFQIYEIEDKTILLRERVNKLLVETRYSAKADILDYYKLNKFASYCRDLEYDDLINFIKSYLKRKNKNNSDLKKLRIIYVIEDRKYYVRAVTSDSSYKDFGINFCVFVALMSLNKYAKQSKREIFINNYVVDDSTIYVSFALAEEVRIDSKLSLSFNLILENDEIKRSAVSFNGVFRLQFKDASHKSEIYLRPKGYIRQNNNYPTDLLTYQHRGNVDTVMEKINELPKLIDYYIKQVSKDAQKISSIKSPGDVKKLISDKIKRAKKFEFKEYKENVYKKLMSMNVDNTFKLFELLREVEELFEHDDVVSRDFWREKLYEALIEGK
jgi:hypothetical protein